MSFFSKLIKPYRKGERNFERGRKAEARRDLEAARDYFTQAAAAFDEHIAEKGKDGKEVRPSHLVMAGICYTRVGRHEDGLRVLDQCLERKEIPDAYLHAGYNAAKLGDADRAMAYWKNYPGWADQRIIANALKEQVALIRAQGNEGLQPACEAVVQAIFKQDIENGRRAKFGPHQYKKAQPVKRRY